MASQKEIINELNDLSIQYSRWFITYEYFKNKRHELLNRLEKIDRSPLSDSSILKDMVSTLSVLIKRS